MYSSFQDTHFISSYIYLQKMWSLDHFFFLFLCQTLKILCPSNTMNGTTSPFRVQKH